MHTTAPLSLRRGSESPCCSAARSLTRADGSRAGRLVDERGREGATRGLVVLPEFLVALDTGDAETASRLADTVFEEAQRCDDDSLLALALLSRGEAALALHETTRGVKLLDEAMVVVTSRRRPPIPAGIVYCGVIDSCMQISDLRRAAEWTDALDRWCAAQPDLVPYRGQCLVHRAQILQARGDWPAAAAAAERACRRLSEPAHPALGLALYEQGELHRLRGDEREAELAYRAASEQGREPAPGMALLRLGQGRVDAAIGAGRRMVEESRGQLEYPKMLAAYAEILIVADDLDTRARGRRRARRACGDGRNTAPARDGLLHEGLGAAGRTRTRSGARRAPARLRRRGTSWTCRTKPPEPASRSASPAGHWATRTPPSSSSVRARAVFERLDAAPDLARVGRLLDSADRRVHAELTDRECEVLRLVATGMTNRAIAAALTVSQHTVGRHLQNIFTKLGVSSRAAAHRLRLRTRHRATDAWCECTMPPDRRRWLIRSMRRRPPIRSVDTCRRGTETGAST